MSALPATACQPLPTADAIGTACHHCGEAVPAAAPRARIEGVTRVFCCAGCAAATQWIAEAALDDYYRLRDGPAGRVDDLALDLSAWDRGELLAEHARDVAGGREITVVTDGMRCAACAWLIDRALMREPGVVEAAANAVTGRIRVVWDPGRRPLSAILGRLGALGYRPYLAAGMDRERERRRERNRDLLRIGVAGLGSMQAMMLAEALYLDFGNTMSVPTRDFFRWITFLVATPIVFWAGWPFIAGAWREVSNRHLGMDTLIATSTLLAWAASTWETARGGQHVWFDAAVMFVFLLLAARLMERRARAVAGAQVDALARARPAFATRERGDGQWETVPLAALSIGDVVRVACGEAVPADGVLLAPTRLEEALLTGESRPVDRAQGEPVYAGTTCRDRPAHLRVTGTGSATRLSQLTRMVEQAQAQRPGIARLADGVAHRFVVGLLLASVVVFVGWRIHDPSRAFEVTLALLIISCPCALSLAVPAALASAHGALARIGVLAVREDALDRLAQVGDIVFDKTGTLADTRPELAHVDAMPGMTPGEALRIAAALERDSRHPIARAFAGVSDAPPATHVHVHGGKGIEGVVEGRRWRIGRAGFATDGTDDGAVWLGDGNTGAARFQLRERAREDARQAIEALRAAGIDVHLSSGDSLEAVHRFAAQMGIVQARGRQSPEDKLEHVRSLQAGGRVVAMVGDGLNDAPVLAGADVSLALGEGAALAQRSADLVLAGSTLVRIPQAIAIARETRRVVRQNLAWATGYNLIALPIAAAGLVTPWLAALGMALSSLLVTANALRLARTGRSVR